MASGSGFGARGQVFGGRNLIGTGQGEFAIAGQVVVVDDGQGLAEPHAHVFQVFRCLGPGQSDLNGFREWRGTADLKIPHSHQLGQPVELLDGAGHPQPLPGLAGFFAGVDKQGFGGGGVVIGFVVGLLQVKAVEASGFPGVPGNYAFYSNGLSGQGRAGAIRLDAMDGGCRIATGGRRRRRKQGGKDQADKG